MSLERQMTISTGHSPPMGHAVETSLPNHFHDPEGLGASTIPDLWPPLAAEVEAEATKRANKYFLSLSMSDCRRRSSLGSRALLNTSGHLASARRLGSSPSFHRSFPQTSASAFTKLDSLSSLSPPKSARERVVHTPRSHLTDTPTASAASSSSDGRGLLDAAQHRPSVMLSLFLQDFYKALQTASRRASIAASTCASEFDRSMSPSASGSEQDVQPSPLADQLAQSRFMVSHRALTNPCAPLVTIEHSDGVTRTVDNINGDLVISVGMILLGWLEVVRELGYGTFGQVVLCKDLRNHHNFESLYNQQSDYCYYFVSDEFNDIDASQGRICAVKVIGARPEFEQQSYLEAQIMQDAVGTGDERCADVCRVLASGSAFGHHCIVMEKYECNLYEYHVTQDLAGQGFAVIRAVAGQVARGLALVHRLGYAHCDIKPENIMLREIPQVGDAIQAVVIDFSSSKAVDDDKFFAYIQSRYYRAPEAIVGCEYGPPMDVWSLGCVLAELLIGRPLLAGANNYQQLCRIITMFGHIPVAMLATASQAPSYYRIERCEAISHSSDWDRVPETGSRDPSSTRPPPLDAGFFEPQTPAPPPYIYTLMSEDEFCANANIEKPPNIRYLKYDSLEEIVKHTAIAPEDAHLQKRDLARQKRALFSLLEGMLQVDPRRRLTCDDILHHPFLTQLFDESPTLSTNKRIPLQ